MKQSIYILSIIIFLFSSCKRNDTEIKITGQFIGDIPNELTYSFPVNGICYEFFNKTTKVDSIGYFEFSLNSKQPCFITLFLQDNRGQLIAEPGETYNITIESKDNENILTFDSNNKSVLDEYQKLASPLHPQFIAIEYWDLPIEIAKKKIDSILLKEISIFENLLSKRAISNELFKLIKLDRELLYNSAISITASHNTIKLSRNNPKANTDSIDKIWKEAIFKIPINSIDFLKSKWSYYYIKDCYLFYHEYMQDGFTFDLRKEARRNKEYHTYLLKIANEHLDEKILEYYTSAYVLSMARQRKFEKELIKLHDEFAINYPNSNYTTYLKPQIKNIVDFHEITAQKYDPNIKFLDDFQNINTLKECLNHFKGKKVYVDIWSTSCGYCKDEFKFNAKLNELLKSKNVDLLYISTDKDKRNQIWKDLIKYYNLKGYHIRANNQLKLDIETTINLKGIPRYLIIDKNGNITNNNAKHPSELVELSAQLDEV